MDIFEKCEKRSRVDEAKELGIYPYFHALESRQDTVVQMEGKRRIMLGSNNYLGLTTDPQVIEAGIHALERYGTGCSGSRFLNGTLEMHLELEAELGEFLHQEAVMTFSTGFQSNLGIISALVGLHDYVICDRENHASIYDGCKLSYGKMLRYRHNDMGDLRRKLEQVPEGCGCLVVTDGVFSMGGDIANLPEIVALAREFGARVMVDDAHGLGVIGEMAAADNVSAEVETEGEQNGNGTSFVYQSQDLLQQAQQLQEMSNATNNQLIWIASISLLVGGIGVMNIMLVSVTERTSEIGLKKALGAKRRRILWQFLTEAAVLTCMGGLLGVLTGVGLAELISRFNSIPVAISIPAIVISVVFSTLIGVIFGLLPAVKAANLNPIEALRRD